MEFPFQNIPTTISISKHQQFAVLFSKVSVWLPCFSAPHPYCKYCSMCETEFLPSECTAQYPVYVQCHSYLIEQNLQQTIKKRKKSTSPIIINFRCGSVSPFSLLCFYFGNFCKIFRVQRLLGYLYTSMALSTQPPTCNAQPGYSFQGREYTSVQNHRSIYVFPHSD